MTTIETASVPKVFNGDEKQKLTNVIRSGMQTMHEIKSLRDGLNDTVKALGEELELKPAIIRRAIKTAFKNEWDKEEDEHIQLENVLIATGMK